MVKSKKTNKKRKKGKKYSMVIDVSEYDKKEEAKLKAKDKNFQGYTCIDLDDYILEH